MAVDDEPLALGLIESYIAKTPFLELAGGYTNALEAVGILQSEKIDLLFLDIQMPEITGLEVASIIDGFTTKVIFTTAFDAYALEGFRVDAIDYLLKPISYAAFLRSAQTAQRLISGATEAAPALEGNLVIKADYRLQKINLSDILYLESQRDYVVVHLENGVMIKTLSTLRSLEPTLPPAFFARVHRSFIVNLSKVKVLERNCIVFGKTLIPIASPYLDEVLQKTGMK
jgi:DNA-binding LytR/AlgR family response regulator